MNHISTYIIKINCYKNLSSINIRIIQDSFIKKFTNILINYIPELQRISKKCLLLVTSFLS